MSRSSAEGTARFRDRGQTEPLAALVAVVAVCLALGLYAGTLEDGLPSRSDRALEAVAVERVEAAIARNGVARPDRIERGPPAGPDGYETNVTLVAPGGRWTAGPPIPPTAEASTASIGVRTGPGAVDPGRLEVRVR